MIVILFFSSTVNAILQMNVVIYAGLSVLLHQNSMFSVPEGLCARVVATAARHLSRDIRLHDTCRLERRNHALYCGMLPVYCISVAQPLSSTVTRTAQN